MTHAHCESCGWAGEIQVGDRLLCVGCANGAPEPAEASPAPSVTILPLPADVIACEHMWGRYLDGSCVECGYC